MIRSTSIRLAALVLGAGLIAVLPASAAAKPKAKTKIEVVNQPFQLPGELPSPDEADGVAVCPRGTTVIGGGALTNAPITVDVDLYKSNAVDNAWLVRYDNDGVVDLLPSAQAICLKDKLKVKGLEDAGKSSAVSSASKPRAISKVTQVDVPFTLPPSDGTNNGIGEADANCPSGTTLVGGGASFGITGDVQLFQSAPQGNGWHVRYDNDEEDEAVTAIATAICLKSKLKVKGENDKARTKVEQVSQQVQLPPNTVNNGRAEFDTACPEGTTVVGGGGRFADSLPIGDLDILLVERGVVGNGWHVRFENQEATAQSATVHALCLKNKLKVK